MENGPVNIEKLNEGILTGIKGSEKIHCLKTLKRRKIKRRYKTANGRKLKTNRQI